MIEDYHFIYSQWNGLLHICLPEPDVYRRQVYQLALVFGGYGDDVVHRQVPQHARLDLDFLCVTFPFHFIARLQLLACHHAGSCLLYTSAAGDTEKEDNPFRCR